MLSSQLGEKHDDLSYVDLADWTFPENDIGGALPGGMTPRPQIA